MHPYESEIKALLEKPELEFEFCNGTMDMDMSDTYVWIDNESKLKELAQVLSKEKVFAVDTEQHSLRSFLGFTALIQVGHIILLQEVIVFNIHVLMLCVYVLNYRFLQERKIIWWTPLLFMILWEFFALYLSIPIYARYFFGMCFIFI